MNNGDDPMASTLSFVFRKATQRDVSRLTEIYNGCFAKWTTEPEKTPGYMSMMISEEDNFSLIVAEDRPGHIAGFIASNCSYVAEAKVMNVDVMAVDPQARRNGLGRALMRMGEMVAHNAGAKAMTLQVVEDNYPAQKLYLGIGFNFYARKPGYYSDGTAALYMVKPLPPQLAANDEIHPATVRPGQRKRWFGFG
jgi:ribosomal protein S18 acetylase RimI-like enzyme